MYSHHWLYTYPWCGCYCFVRTIGNARAGLWDKTIGPTLFFINLHSYWDYGETPQL